MKAQITIFGGVRIRCIIYLQLCILCGRGSGHSPGQGSSRLQSFGFGFIIQSSKWSNMWSYATDFLKSSFGNLVNPDDFINLIVSNLFTFPEMAPSLCIFVAFTVSDSYTVYPV